MRAFLVFVPCLALLAIGSGCVVVPHHPHHPRPVVRHHPPPAPRPVVVVPAPPPVVVVRPQPVPEPPPIVVNPPKPRRSPNPVVVIDPPHPRHSPPPVVVHARQPAPAPVVIINPREREVIREYVLHKKSKGLPRGLAKKVERGGNLPPGWQRRCVRGEIMPIEVYQHCEPLPPEVVVKLPATPPGTITVTLDGRAIRLLQATREILDVFDVF